MTQGCDAVTAEVLRNAFNAIARDMSAVLGRSAYSPVIYEMNDFGVGLFTAACEMLGQAPGHPGFIGGLDWGVRAVADKYGTDAIHPGDVFLINDSYVTGGHLSDVDVITPIFCENDLVAFASSRAHWLDIGTADPGFPVNTCDIHQEGLRLGAVRIQRAGVWVEDVIEILRWNSRLPRVLMGDLRAQIAAGRMAQRRYSDLVARFGQSTIAAATKRIFADSERKMRAFISSIPDGVYCEEAFSDDDFITGEPIRVRVTVVVDGSALRIDTTGSSPQATSGINSGYANTVSAARLALLFLHPDTEPEVTHGTFVPLEVRAEPRSIFAAEEPAACMHPHPVMLLLDLVIRALAPVAPTRVAAGLPGDSWNVFVMGIDPCSEEMFISGESLDGGWGANAMEDGESAIIHSLGGDFRNMPVETMEGKYPIRVRRLEMGCDSAGAGKYRGGLNVVKEYEVLADCRLTLHFDRAKTPQWGLFGGGAGATPGVTIQPAGSNELLHVTKIEQLPLCSGSRFTARTGGGGGFGNPLERDPMRVLFDVRCGDVSLEAAEAVYGVIVRGEPPALDALGTRQRRARRGEP